MRARQLNGAIKNRGDLTIANHETIGDRTGWYACMPLCEDWLNEAGRGGGTCDSGKACAFENRTAV